MFSSGFVRVFEQRSGSTRVFDWRTGFLRALERRRERYRGFQSAHVFAIRVLNQSTWFHIRKESNFHYIDRFHQQRTSCKMTINNIPNHPKSISELLVPFQSSLWLLRLLLCIWRPTYRRSGILVLGNSAILRLSERFIGFFTFFLCPNRGTFTFITSAVLLESARWVSRTPQFQFREQTCRRATLCSRNIPAWCFHPTHSPCSYWSWHQAISPVDEVHTVCQIICWDGLDKRSRQDAQYLSMFIKQIFLQMRTILGYSYHMARSYFDPYWTEIDFQASEGESEDRSLDAVQGEISKRNCTQDTSFHIKSFHFLSLDHEHQQSISPSASFPSAKEERKTMTTPENIR